MLALVFVLAACDQDETVTWKQYNADDDTLTLEVGVDDLLPAVSAPLTSNTGAVEIGTATADPGGGPIDTLHTLKVEVFAEYAEDVDRVSVRLDAGDRGEDEYDLDADSTGEGIWVLQVRSVGDVGEVRTDTLTFRLWDEVVDTGDASTEE